MWSLHITNLKDLLKVSKIATAEFTRKILLQRYTSLAIETLLNQKKYFRSPLLKSRGACSAESLQAHKALGAELLPESGLQFSLKFGKGRGRESICILSDIL